MHWTKIRAFVTGQNINDLREAAGKMTHNDDERQRNLGSADRPADQEIIHGRIAAGPDQRSSMTGGLLGNGRLFG